MTIKEVEARTGLARANIRYYEEQGFFAAARGENGYRNYSEEDVDTLLKVKLLRQLGFSLEEIHELQNGERSLEPALERREADRVFQAVIDAEGNLHEDFDGFRVDCETEFSGYHLYFHEGIEENVLSGIGGEKQSYFVEFSVNLR